MREPIVEYGQAFRPTELFEVQELRLLPDGRFEESKLIGVAALRIASNIPVDAFACNRPETVFHRELASTHRNKD